MTPVAILLTAYFDALSIDVSTLTFGPGGATPAHPGGHPMDIDDDGLTDLLVHFSTAAATIACGDPTATVTGETVGGELFHGVDESGTVGCE